MNILYADELLAKCYKAINPYKNPDLIRELAAYISTKPKPAGHVCGNCGADLSNYPTSSAAHKCAHAPLRNEP